MSSVENPRQAVAASCNGGPHPRPAHDTRSAGAVAGTTGTADVDRLARVALSCLIEPGSRALGTLVDHLGAPAALAAVRAGAAATTPEDRSGPAGPAAAPLPAAAMRRLRATVAVRLAADTDPLCWARRMLEETVRLGGRVIIPSDREWPDNLADLRSISVTGADRIREDTYPPLCLWIRGGPPLAEACRHSVSIVGARAATGYGIHVATDLAFGLAARRWSVVSGGAYGIDAAAHRGAMSGGGVTVAVLACGVDRPYPAGNASLFERIVEDGLLVSEWPLGTDPHRHRFLVRNRVIAALTGGTVVVEASARSGARQTLGRAIELGRTGMVVPGPVTSAMSVGCHTAVRNWDARLVTTASEILEDVGRIGEHLAPVPRASDQPRDRLDVTAQQVLDAVRPRHPSGIEEIAAVAGVPLRQTMAALALLEEGGFVVRHEQGFTLVRTGATTGGGRADPDQPSGHNDPDQAAGRPGKDKPAGHHDPDQPAGHHDPDQPAGQPGPDQQAAQQPNGASAGSRGPDKP